ncbi:hypothetical protein E2562_006657 [Oryza meyeriana var. granulata]|uniref:Carbohydrate kinase PfkB domain-containing protein n=1 Tax=Oryza meyeriana var. granulata TaxID=110450 RepID=A0A6G1EI98_9ORYZ|nr:hypothetical protein E2562_006657 [Oryza meyeriana var. granulata]
MAVVALLFPSPLASPPLRSSTSRPRPLQIGVVSTDYLATVASFPNPDDKIRSLMLKVQGGGNTSNALTTAARLGLHPKIISKMR